LIIVFVESVICIFSFTFVDRRAHQRNDNKERPKGRATLNLGGKKSEELKSKNIEQCLIQF
jgi:hypothetical protein